MKHVRGLFCMLVLVSFLMASCGGSSGSSSSTDPAATPPAPVDNGDGNDPAVGTKVSGLASKGLVMGGQVSVFKVVGGKKGDLLATATTAADGTYSADIGDYTGPVLIEVVGGKYKDEATGAVVPLVIPLRAALPAAEGEVKAAVTPLTELAVHVAERTGFSEESIGAANEMFSQLLGEGKSIVETMPRDVMSEGAEGDDAYGLLLAGISGMANVEGSLADALKVLGDDLDDGMLDEYAGALVAEMEGFIEREGEAVGLDGIPAELEEAIEEIRDEGFAPTGDLKEVKALLVALFAADVDDPASDFEGKLNDFLAYMDTFVADTPEAHLYKAAALLADLYNDEGLGDLKNFGINLEMEPGFFPLTAEQVDELSIALLEATAAGETIGLKQVLKPLVSKIDLVVAELTKAEGASMCISITGLDMVCMDTVDLDLMRGALLFVKAVCVYIDSVNLAVTEWAVAVDGVYTGDIRNLNLETLSDGDDIVVLGRFLDNNPDLLTYLDERAGLVSFKAAWDQAGSFFSRAIATLDSMGEEKRRARENQALTFDSESGFCFMKFQAQVVLPSVNEAWMTPGATEVTVLLEEDSDPAVDVYIADDGYAYAREYTDFFSQVRVAGNEITIYNLLNKDGEKSLKDCVTTKPSYAPQNGVDPTPLQLKVSEVYWDEPFEVVAVPMVSGLIIDGNSSDWASVEPCFHYQGEGNDFVVKIAQNESGKLCMAVIGTVIGDISYGVGFFARDMSNEWRDLSRFHLTWFNATAQHGSTIGSNGTIYIPAGQNGHVISEEAFLSNEGVLVGGEIEISDQVSDLMIGNEVINGFGISRRFFNGGWQRATYKNIKLTFN